MSNLLERANKLASEAKIAEAIQTYEEIIRSDNDHTTLAQAYLKLGHIYQNWGELFAAQRFLSHAHKLDPENKEIRDAVDNLNQYFTQNHEQITDQMSRQNSDQIVSLFRIATGIKLIAMDKPIQAYPLMKSRTKIFPNAAVAKHLLTDISITEAERNSAIDFLIEREWLINTGDELYSIAESGLHAFYIALAQLHIDNSAHSEAIECYDQAYWLDKSKQNTLFQKVICYAELESWNEAAATINALPAEVPDDIDRVKYYTAIAQTYHHLFQEKGADADKQQVIYACEEVLRIDKKDKNISKLFASYQDKKPWWKR